MSDFAAEVAARIAANACNATLRSSAHAFLFDSVAARYSYNFSWLGRPIIQYPQDMVAIQQLVWKVRPDLIIETGIAHGGSLILSASLLALLDYCDAAAQGGMLDPHKPQRRVLGVDIDIRPHNREAIEQHPLAARIDLIEGSSIARETVTRVHAAARQYKRVLVCLDSNHTHAHVLAELEAYAPLISKGSYCVVFDTLVEDLPRATYPDRPWDKGNNPKTAVREYLRLLREEGRLTSDGLPLQLEVDRTVQDSLLVTVAPEGYLRRL